MFLVVIHSFVLFLPLSIIRCRSTLHCPFLPLEPPILILAFLYFFHHLVFISLQFLCIYCSYYIIRFSISFISWFVIIRHLSSLIFAKLIYTFLIVLPRSFLPKILFLLHMSQWFLLQIYIVLFLFQCWCIYVSKSSLSCLYFLVHFVVFIILAIYNRSKIFKVFTASNLWINVVYKS